MRLNRNTLILLVAALVVIGVVFFLNGQSSTSTTTGTPTPTPSGAGPLFTDLTGDAINGLQVQDNVTGAYVALARGEDGAWVLNATNAADRGANQQLANDTAATVAGLTATSSFVSADLAQYGLEAPQYSVFARSGDTTYRIYVGAANPQGNRNYVIVEQDGAALVAESTEVMLPPAPDAEATEEATAEPDAEATAEATAEPSVTLSGERTIYIVTSANITDLTRLITDPPYEPSPTPSPSPTRTPNPLSEVDMTATSDALFEQLIQTATASAPTPEPETTDAAEATAEMTDAAEATATPES